MSLDEYLLSKDFAVFKDETLRNHACESVERYLGSLDPNDRRDKPVKKVQLHSIPIAIQAGGGDELKKLIENQIKRNTKKENQRFWSFINELILLHPGPDSSLRSLISQLPEVQNRLQNDSNGADKREQKKIRKQNRKHIELVMEQLLEIYFEHFNCHYFYKTGAAS